MVPSQVDKTTDWATRFLVESRQQQIEDSLIAYCICSMDPKCDEINKLEQTTQFAVQKHRDFNHGTEWVIVSGVRARDNVAFSC